MPVVLVPLAEGFEEIEAVTLIDVLRRADIQVITAGLNGRQVTGSHGICLQTDCLLDEVLDREFDLIALPGGMPGAQHLNDDTRLFELLQAQAAASRPVAAICAAPMVLENAGLLIDRAATSYPGFLDADLVDYREDAVVSDSGITTSRGPATALRFALTLVEQLVGPDKRAALEEKMLVQQHGTG